ncbi:MAG: hypothetical protein ABIN18_00775 [Pseudomonadota bacterium]
MRIERFEDIEAWQLARELTRKINARKVTLVCDSATLESLFRSNWPLRRSEAALNGEP